MTRKRTSYRLFPLLGVFILAAAVFSRPGFSEEKPLYIYYYTEVPDENGWVVHGRNSLRTVGRFSGEDSDWDFTDYFTMTVRDAWAKPRFRVHLDALGRADLDGAPEEGEPSLFRDVYDSYDLNILAWIYSAYWEILGVIPHTNLRIGRQFLDWEETVYFDGGRVEFQPVPVMEFTFVGGMPVEFSEIAFDAESLVGGGIRLNPAAGLWAGVNYLRNSDADSESADHLVFTSAKYVPTRNMSFSGRVSFINNEESDEGFKDRRYHLAGLFRLPRLQFTAALNLTLQRRTLAEYTNEFSDFFLTAREVRPFFQVRGYLGVGLKDVVSVTMGYDQRMLLDDEDEGTFNHEFVHPFVDLTVTRLGLPGLTLTAVVEYWDTADNDVLAFDGSLARRFGKKGRAVLGADYQAYAYDALTGEEEENVTTFYARGRYLLVGKTSLLARYQLSTGGVDDETIHRVEGGVQTEF